LSDDIANRARVMSRRELFRFEAYAENYGVKTTIVGGWAVYAFNPYLESIDIDVVVPKDRISNIELILTQQCGWTQTTTDLGIWKRFSKQIPDADPSDNIFFDLLSEDLTNPFHEDNNKRIPFSICLQSDHYIRRSIDENTRISVPIKELLFLYKLKSHRDRIFDLTSKEINEPYRSRLRAKATKDLSDSTALLDPNYGLLDLDMLKHLISNLDIQFLVETIRELPSQTEAVEQYRGTSPAEVRNGITQILEAMS